MQTARVAVVGGGLSGLYAAFLLQQRGIHDYLVFEARKTPGGRILSVPATAHGDAGSKSDAKRDRLDLGPTWFWPDLQPQLGGLIHDLGITSFEQRQTGDMMVERSHGEPPMRMRGYTTAPVSMRLAGGIATLTDTLAAALDAKSVFTGEAVRSLRFTGRDVELSSEDLAGNFRTACVDHVLLALPPRLVESNISFEPALPQALVQQWRSIDTWMAPHAKYVATYPSAFWRQSGLSGEARSACGPLGEIHDASTEGGNAALFGFFGIPAGVRRNVKEAVLRMHCRTQLARLFGPRAATPEAEFIKDWACDPHTATIRDIEGASQRIALPAANAPLGSWSERLTGIASEWSPQFPGYLAGAIDAAHRGVQALSSHNHSASRQGKRQSI
ncbi:flavin monoamine oxidase family protein [Paraburkholderia sp. B3]|uniref:flavin monoamine oxidase family protein n=1 Tax=Paraburkholderia sp. B3 TaxID=3134791 RepID=UPI0039823D74